MTIESALAGLASRLPSLRNQFGFIGLVLVVGALVFGRALEAEPTSQLAAGSIGVAFLVFGQAFYYLGRIQAPDRARYILALFGLFCAFVLALVVATAVLGAGDQPSFSDVSLESSIEPNARANTLDDLRVRWSYTGLATDARIRVIETTSGKTTEWFETAGELGEARLTSQSLQTLWPDPRLGQDFSVVVEFAARGRSSRFGPFDVATAMRLLYYLDGRKLTVAAMTTTHGVQHHSFSCRAVAWPSSPNELDGPVSIQLSAVDGKGSADFPMDVDADTIRVVYLGSYPDSLVRPWNAHTN